MTVMTVMTDDAAAAVNDVDSLVRIKQVIETLPAEEHRVLYDIVREDGASEQALVSSAGGVFVNLSWLSQQTITRLSRHLQYKKSIDTILSAEDARRTQFVSGLTTTTTASQGGEKDGGGGARAARDHSRRRPGAGADADADAPAPGRRSGAVAPVRHRLSPTLSRKASRSLVPRFNRSLPMTPAGINGSPPG